MEQELILNICDFAKEAKECYRDGKMEKCLEHMRQFMAIVRSMQATQDIFDESVDLFHISLMINNSDLVVSILTLLERMEKQFNTNEAMLKLLGVKIKYAEAMNAVDMLETLYDEYYKLKKLQIQDVHTLKVRNIKFKISMKQVIVERRQYFLESEQTKKKAETDKVTQLPNRYCLRSYCKELFPRARVEGKEVGVIMIDIDSFSAIQECYGSQGGERCLKVVADSILSSAEGQFCARFDEDNFILLTYDLSKENVYEIAGKIRRTVEGKKISQAANELSEFVTVSQGIVVGYPTERIGVEEFFHAADEVLLHGKSRKKNAIMVGRLPVITE